jgi:hypothetical protein
MFQRWADLAGDDAAGGDADPAGEQLVRHGQETGPASLSSAVQCRAVQCSWTAMVTKGGRPYAAK